MIAKVEHVFLVVFVIPDKDTLQMYGMGLNANTVKCHWTNPGSLPFAFFFTHQVESNPGRRVTSRSLYPQVHQHGPEHIFSLPLFLFSDLDDVLSNEIDLD